MIVVGTDRPLVVGRAFTGYVITDITKPLQEQPFQGIFVLRKATYSEWKASVALHGLTPNPRARKKKYYYEVTTD
jgi:hypothetical protein